MESVKVFFNIYHKDGNEGHYNRNFKTMSYFMTHIKTMTGSYKIELRADDDILICNCYEYIGILRGDKHGKV